MWRLPTLLSFVGLIGLAATAALPSPTFSNPAARQYRVDSNVPGIPFQLNETYAGMIPVSKEDDSRQLFYWMHLADQPSDNIVLWFQGGPGCSGLEALFQENGPITLAFNSTTVVPNPFSWTRSSHVIYLDQPVGTGLSKGRVDARNEADVAKELIGFLENFFDIFTEFKGKSLWLAGESYGGMYVFYLADALYSRPASVNAAAGINLQGLTTIDAVLSSDMVQSELGSVGYASAHQAHLKLSDAFMTRLKAEAKQHGLLDYMDKHLTYPPKGPIPIPDVFTDPDPDYDPWSNIMTEAKAQVGPSFNIYNTKPAYSWYAYDDPLGFLPNQTRSSNNFINNVKGFKTALHADESIDWKACAEDRVFVYGNDASLPPDRTVLNRVLDKNAKTLIQHGLQDFLLIANGTKLVIQNATFGGAQGFLEAPHRPFIVDGRRAGTFHSERNVTYVEFLEAGHEIPMYDPPAALKAIQYLVGDISLDDLGK
ncbi:hypothetical protein OC834_006296 [Tilletia horrida]|uniref:Carboxypeptidase n=1 Tax=Tilletia horrida TaxID=155126 RepID=A0AAN6JIE3_9BASI|nr:hypothetical protein OC834_006296 [Tilletia horrida]KAK0524895.1 hypothetical protein OC842_005683 [Tilletia horrida]KAK0529141.1 hypothetical protein OC835_004424 [Tilletia horrida]KAK0559824.1 hypothetical protein OC844_004152 [Tilletia horrida]